MRAAVRVATVVVLGKRLRIEGLEHVPRRGPALLVGNHVGAIDPVMLGIHIPRLDVYYMAKSELFRRRVTGWLFRHCHTFPVVRDSPDRTALRQALDVLRRGHLLVVYPEGTRADRAAGGRAHPGAGFIARHARVPIVPVAAAGSDGVLPRGAIIPRRAPVRIVIGEPFAVPDIDDAGRPLGHQAATDLMMARVRALLPGDDRRRQSGAPPAA